MLGDANLNPNCSCRVFVAVAFFVARAGVDGIDRLLQIVAYYRRRQPQSPEVICEESHVEL